MQVADIHGWGHQQTGFFFMYLLCENDHEPECAALAGCAIQADLATHGFDQLSGNSQSQPGATITPCG